MRLLKNRDEDAGQEDREQMKPGDLVRLRGGGRLMTVRWEIDAAASSATGREIGVHCDWHADDGAACSAVYHPDQLLSEALVHAKLL